jgi:hypothetical protein
MTVWLANNCCILSASLRKRKRPELADPNGRCAKCIAGKRYALNRILELARLETGHYRLLLAYIGYNFYELDKPSALDAMERVGREALVEAYQRHEITRETRSLFLCPGIARCTRPRRISQDLRTPRQDDA